ncbi:hypothetical protein V8G54_002960 [Vigna mungo]|uniref:Uncharacterized protein n=1 Tax=Vigna mungo TaxID=3915 RepID=A0AAQ3P993_VIGMU
MHFWAEWDEGDALTALVESTLALENGLQNSLHFEVHLRARRSLKCDLIAVGSAGHTVPQLKMHLSYLKVQFHCCHILTCGQVHCFSFYLFALLYLIIYEFDLIFIFFSSVYLKTKYFTINIL